MPLKAPTTDQSAGRQTIQKAFKNLERAVSPGHSQDFSSTTLQDVRNAAIEIERQLAARQLLRNMQRLEPLFRGLAHYSQVIEVLCNGTDFLSWIWAPIKLILKISSDCIEAFEQLIEAYSKIADSLRRYEMLQQSFKDKPQLYPIFAVFYADILYFHKEAYKFVTRRGWKVLFATSWGRFKRKFNTIIANLSKHGDLIDKEVNAHNIIEARETRVQLEVWRAQSLERLNKDDREQMARQMQGLIAWLGLDDTEQAITEDTLIKVGSQYPGTVDWVLQNTVIKAWLRLNSSIPFVWLQGGPGTGKSVITARLLTFLNISPKNSLVIRHFCSYSDSSSAHHDQLMKSLLIQCIRKDGDLVAHIYEKHVGSSEATLRLVGELFETAIEARFGDDQNPFAIYILLDGLDECSSDRQRYMVRMMERVVKGGVCKVLISSRDTAALRGKLKKKPRIDLSEEKSALTKAITEFASKRLQTMQDRLNDLGVSEDHLRAIAGRIGVRSDGMFLWARLVLNYLTANFFYNAHEFEKAVDDLPRELSDFYDKILTRIISELDARSIQRLTAIFGWIAFAKRPLRKAELQSALLFHDNEPIGERPAPPYIIEACKPLVEERRNSTLLFIHSSVKDYLQARQNKESIHLISRMVLWENGLALLRCLHAAFKAFTSSYPEEKRDLQLLRGVWGFIPYATEFWCVELREMVSLPDAEWDPRFRTLAAEVSTMLSESRQGYNSTCLGLEDQRLESIRYLPSLWHDATIALQVRHERRSLQAKFRYQEKTPEYPNSLLTVPESYERAIQSLLSLRYHADLSLSELEQFRDRFGCHAYPCRLYSCIYALQGFQNNSQRIAHEAQHTPTFPCLVSHCQYPLFGSIQGLKRHQEECHTESNGQIKLKTGLQEPRYSTNFTRTTSTQGTYRLQSMPSPSRIINTSLSITNPPQLPHAQVPVAMDTRLDDAAVQEQLPLPNLNQTAQCHVYEATPYQQRDSGGSINLPYAQSTQSFPIHCLTKLNDEESSTMLKNVINQAKACKTRWIPWGDDREGGLDDIILIYKSINDGHVNGARSVLFVDRQSLQDHCIILAQSNTSFLARSAESQMQIRNALENHGSEASRWHVSYAEIFWEELRDRALTYARIRADEFWSRFDSFFSTGDSAFLKPVDITFHMIQNPDWDATLLVQRFEAYLSRGT